MTITDTTDTTDREWLPNDRSCPSWCNGEHAQSLAEGNGWEDSQEHQGDSHEHMLEEHRNPVDHRVTRTGGAKWSMYPRLRQRPPEPVLGGRCHVRSGREPIGAALDTPETRDTIRHGAVRVCRCPLAGRR